MISINYMRMKYIKKLIVNNDLLTMYIQNRLNSSKLKGCSQLQLLYNLIISCPASAYFAYTNR